MLESRVLNDELSVLIRKDNGFFMFSASKCVYRNVLNMRDALSSTLLPIDLRVRIMIYIAYNNITSRLVASPGRKVTCNLIY